MNTEQTNSNRQEETQRSSGATNNVPQEPRTDSAAARSGAITPDDVDAGGVGTAAFDEGNEPRSEESTGANRGITQGSDDAPDGARQ